MKQKLIDIYSYVYKESIWRLIALLMILILIIGGVIYALNYFNPTRTEFIVTTKEFRKNALNIDLSETDEIDSKTTKEEYDKRFNAFKGKIPNAEWDKIEIKLTDEQFDAKVAEWRAEMDMVEPGGKMPPFPVKEDNLPYSMKRFFKDLEESHNIDSADFDARLNLLEKVEHFYSISDKKGGDTLMVDKFKDILSKSANLTMDEIISVEKMHKKLTKTPPVFSLTAINSDFERQTELFKLYEAAANTDMTVERFVQLDTIIKRLSKNKITDTVTVLNLLAKVMNVDFYYLKSNEEVDYTLEATCIDDFFKSGRFTYNKDNLLDNFDKYIRLYKDKLEAANLERKAREILRQENRNFAKDWMYFGLFFLCFSVIIVQLVNKQKNQG
ncbi:MAG: hypothetical protein ACKO4Y_06000 [Flavobacteriales bacterium]